jgi:hypothetical protein
VEIEDYVRDTVTYMQSKYEGKLTCWDQVQLGFSFSVILITLC